MRIDAPIPQSLEWDALKAHYKKYGQGNKADEPYEPVGTPVANRLLLVFSTFNYLYNEKQFLPAIESLCKR